MNPVVPLLFAVGLLVGIRHRSRAGAGFLLAATTVMCGADYSEEPLPVDSVTIGVGTAGGRYQEICGPSRRYVGGAVSAEYRRTVARDLEITGSLQAGGAADTALEPNDVRVTRLGFSVQPLVGFDHRYFALALGAHFGRFNPETESAVVPSGRVRIGARDLFFVDASLADDFAGPFPGMIARVGLGFGLPPVFEPGAWNHPILRLGVSSTGLVGAAEIGVGRQFRIDALVAYGDRNYSRGSIGLKWRPRLRRPTPVPLDPDMLPTL